MVSEWSVLRLGDETLTVGPYVRTGRPHLALSGQLIYPGHTWAVGGEGVRRGGGGGGVRGRWE